MDIGTGKDLASYTLADGSAIPYHLIDIADAGSAFDVFKWQKAFNEAYRSVNERGKRAILVGGSGLYLETALKGVTLSKAPVNATLRSELEHLSAEDLCTILQRFPGKTEIKDPNNKRRLVRSIEIATYEAHSNQTTERSNKPFPYILLLIDLPKEERINRIHSRLQKRLSAGLIEEVEALLQSGVPEQTLINYGLEYKYITLFLTGELSKEEAITRLEIAIRQFAKRQMTWFRGMERRGFTLHPIDGTKPIEAQLQQALNAIANAPTFPKEKE